MLSSRLLSTASTDFNSIKVRLKHAANAGANVVRAFQFHKGTIKTGFRYRSPECSDTFQFHKGTIKTQAIS